MPNKNKLNTILLVIIIILLSASLLYLYYNNSNKINNNLPPVDIISDIYNDEDTKPQLDRMPNQYICVGEYCDGSMNGDQDQLTILRIPLVTSGGNIGCGAKIFLAPHTTPKTASVLDATYRLLFDLKSQPEVKADDIRNPIGDYTKLFYKSVTIENGTAKVMLTGSMYGPGHCSYPEIREQINQAAFQFDTVKRIEVYLNGKIFNWCLLSDADPSESKCDINPKYWIDEK